MSRLLKIVLVLVLAVACFQAPGYSGQDEDIFKLKSKQPIIVDGDTVEYFEEESKIVAVGNVSVTYGDIKLTCDRIEVNTKAQVALCQGNVRIEQPDGILTGERIRYDFLNKEGEIIGGEVEAFPWFGRAEETGKVGKNEYLLRNGYITTCDLDKPHYRIKAQEIRVFPDDKIIAKNVVFYVGEIPVLWVPYYYHPIIQSRAKVQFIPGWNTDWGYFLLSASRFYLKGNSKVDVRGDYRTKKGFAYGADCYYFCDDLGLTGLGDGIFRAYIIQQNDKGTIDPTPFRDDNKKPEIRRRFQWKHRINFDPTTVGMLEFNKWSDQYVLRDYFYNEYEESGQEPESYASIISSQQNFICEINFKKKFNDFKTVVQKMPELKIDIPDQRLWETPLYYNSQGSFTIFDKRYAFDHEAPEEVNRFDTFHKLSYVTNLGPLNLTPFGTFSETVYSRNRWEGDIISRETIGGGLNGFARYYRIFDVKSDIMGLDIDGLRHIIVPSFKYFHTHAPTVDRNNLFEMDEIDTLEKRNGVNLSLETRLQTRRMHDGKKDPVDLIRFIIKTDFLFRMEKDKLKFKKEGQFRNLLIDLELKPYSWFFVNSEVEINPKNQALKRGYIEGSIRPWDGLRCDLGYRYEKFTTKPRNQFTYDLEYKINPKWTIGLYQRFNFDDQKGAIEEQQLKVIRDLHCWEAEFVYNVDGSNLLQDNFTMWLAFKIKAFPDLQLGLSRSFKTRSPGAFRN